MHRLPTEKRTQILHMLVEGMSIRSTARVVGVSTNTVLKLVVESGRACYAYHNEHVRGVKARRIQCDEIWSFCYVKDKNLPTAKSAPKEAGSIWTWTAIDRDTKLIISWLVSSSRDEAAAQEFMIDLRGRTVGRPQIVTDGLAQYVDATIGAFSGFVNYAQLVKSVSPRNKDSDKKVSMERKVVRGRVPKSDISTSYVERHNLTLRMGMRRFTRRTNAFSKKFQNHIYSTALFLVWYNFGREHSSLSRHKVPGVTPAMKAGLASEPLTLERIVEMTDRYSAMVKCGCV